MPVRRRARLNPGGIEQRDARSEPREPGAAEGRALRAIRCRTDACRDSQNFVPNPGISLVRYQQEALPSLRLAGGSLHLARKQESVRMASRADRVYCESLIAIFRMQGGAPKK